MSTQDHVELKGLQGQKQKLLTRLKEAQNQRNESDRLINDVSFKIKKINDQLENIATKDVVISEHALLRYLERVFNLDIEKIKKIFLMKTPEAKLCR